VAAATIGREHLSNTLWDFSWMSGADVLEGRDAPLASGFLGDRVMGGVRIQRAVDPKNGLYSFDALFAAFNVYGFTPEEVIRLVGEHGIEDAVAEVIEESRARYEAIPGYPFQKSWLWGLNNRLRFHVAPYAWRLSDAAWPLMPYADREMLEVAAGTSLDHFAGRRMQVDTLKREFTRLAGLPVDRNDPDTTPLIPSRAWMIKSCLAAQVPYRLRSRRERRTYYKTFDINNAGWVAIRAMAEPNRRRTRSILRNEVVDRYLPPPGTPIQTDDAIVGTANMKILLSLMILAGEEPRLADGFAGN
jgi:hypothetical protein